MRSKVEDVRTALMPRKKFSFAARRKQKQEGAGDSAAAPTKSAASPPEATQPQTEKGLSTGVR